ncbi:TetR/AcrR family transcriptional regulator [Streptomyces boninensis]|uniref:TetR/AcrR family transcriptional regulator n=1 Tax=Streptomyces boninensis TaxID=2039455 RepID=UPI003B214ACE
MAITQEPVRRSRLSSEREHELFEAVLDLLRESGYESLTMDAIAARTHASKATLYRQWKGKPQLVATALKHAKPTRWEDVDTGSLRGDLLELYRCGVDEADRDRSLMRGLSQAVHSHPELHEALRELLIHPEMEKLGAVVQRAVDRGEVAPDAPAREFLVHMLMGAVTARDLVEAAPIDLDYLIRYTDAVVLPALRAT